MDEFVTAVSRKTGKKQRIPAEWLENPRMAAKFKLPPSATAKRKEPADAPAADVVDPTQVDENTAPPTDATPGDPNTPAAGGEQEN